MDFFQLKDKKVFITGHTGFKGSWLCEILLHLGANIKGYALAPNQNPSLFQLLKLEQRMESIIADINDLEKLSSEIKSFQPDIIFHLAAQPLVRESYDTPIYTFQTNAIGTANLLESVKTVEGKCVVVNITTDKVYENKEWIYPYREEDALGGYDPYSASKAAAEIIISSYRRSFFHPDKYETHQKSITSVRAGNVIGGGDWSKDRIIPDVIRALESEIPINVRNPKAVRPWQLVIEPIFGYIQLALLLSSEPQKYVGAYNFGPNPQDNFTVKEFVEEALKVWGTGTWIDGSDPNALHEANLLKLDISKANADLKWFPQLTAKEAINWTVEWYKLYKENPQTITQSQIKKYLALLS